MPNPLVYIDEALLPGSRQTASKRPQNLASSPGNLSSFVHQGIKTISRQLRLGESMAAEGRGLEVPNEALRAPGMRIANIDLSCPLLLLARLPRISGDHLQGVWTCKGRVGR